MLSHTRAALVTLILPALATPAAAQDYYGSLFGGASILTDQTLSGTVGGAPQTVRNEFDTGYNIGVALGRDIPGLGGNGVDFRGEFELSFSDGDADAVFFSGNGPAAEVNVGGDVRTTRLFLNGFADFDTGGSITPYIGLGVGAARSDFGIVYGPGVRLSDEDTTFSTQVIAGASYDINDTLSLIGDIRYIRDFDVEVDRLSPAGALTGVVEDDVESFQVNVGLRFQF